MLFTFPCSCGKFLLVEEGSARQFVCPECGRIHDMPQRALPAAPAAEAVPEVPPTHGPVLPDTETLALAPDDEKSPGVLPAPGFALALEPSPAVTPQETRTERPRVAETGFGVPLQPVPSNEPERVKIVPPPVVPSAPPATAIQVGGTPLPMAVPVTAPPSDSAAYALKEAPPLPGQATPNPEEQAVIEEARVRKRAERKRTWSRLILGFGFYYGQFLSNLVTLTILMLGINIMSLVEERAQPRLAAFLILVTALGFFLVGPGLGIAGSSLCLNVPEKVGRPQLMQAALGLSIAPVVFGFIFSVFLCIGGVMLAAVLMGILGLMAMYGAWICFMFFIKQVSEYMEMALCADEAAHFVLLSIPLMVAPLCLLVLGVMLADVSLGPVLIMLLITVWLVFNSKFMVGVLHLVSAVRQAIRTRERV